MATVGVKLLTVKWAFNSQYKKNGYSSNIRHLISMKCCSNCKQFKCLSQVQAKAQGSPIFSVYNIFLLNSQWEWEYTYMNTSKHQLSLLKVLHILHTAYKLWWTSGTTVYVQYINTLYT